MDQPIRSTQRAGARRHTGRPRVNEAQREPDGLRKTPKGEREDEPSTQEAKTTSRTIRRRRRLVRTRRPEVSGSTETGPKAGRVNPKKSRYQQPPRKLREGEWNLKTWVRVYSRCKVWNRDGLESPQESSQKPEDPSVIRGICGPCLLTP